MKKIVLVFFIGVLCAANSFGADNVVISRAIPVKNNIEKTENTTDTTKNRAARRVNVSRNTTKNAENATRANVQKNDINVIPRATRKTVNRQSVEDIANTVGRNARTDAASINSNPAVRRAGVVLRATTAEVGGRAKIIGTNTQTGSNIDESVRNIRGRATSLNSSKTQNKPTAESIALAKDNMEKLADLNNTCQQQYNECMDQFCMVIDANQKRCSCSANLAKYAAAQKAVEEANTELNDVAQNIRYIGLSADEIRAIMNATEAELAMSKTKDNTQTRSMLDDIADMIKDPTAASSTSLYSDSQTNLLDMDFDFSSDSSDLFGLELFSSNSNDISSKRGKDLYKEATKRCKTVLNQCKDAGGTESQIVGNYDLAIDKDCIAYEQGLEKLNQQLVSNVRSANLMLQKARLSVLQNKNQYDVRGCIGALENCMLDDMVCGEGYIKCLDPTKNYIDENGKVVLGRNIENITAFTQEYSNSNINADFIKASINDTTCQKQDGACIVNYLMNKIGTGQSFKDGGLCRAVLDKCQYYTYTGTNDKTARYNPYNEVVINYIQRAMVNIKAAQSKIISDYASSCLTDVSDCYNQQVTQINALTTGANADSVYNVMTGACYNVALTCGYAVFAYDVNMAEKILAEPQEANKRLILIRAISDLFYQSLICPTNSTFVSNYNINSSGRADANETPNNANEGNITQAIQIINRKIRGYVNTRCQCNDGYSVWNGTCMETCSNNEYRNNLGICVSCGESIPSGGNDTMENNACIASCPAHSTKTDAYHTVSDNGTAQGYTTSRCQCNDGYIVLDGACVQACPENSTFVYGNTNADANRTIHGFATYYCQCGENYSVWSGECRVKCADNQIRDANGVCRDCNGNQGSPSANMEPSNCPTGGDNGGDL